MGTVLRALLASIIITFLSWLDGVPVDLYLLRKFVIYFVVLWITFSIMKKVEERKGKK